MSETTTESIPTTSVDYEIDRAIREAEVGKLLNIYSAAGACNTKEFGVIQGFVDWIHNLKVRGYGVSPQETEPCGFAVPVATGCDGREQPPLVCGLLKNHDGPHLFLSGQFLIDLNAVPEEKAR